MQVGLFIAIIVRGRKMRTYIKFKQHFAIEEYLTSLQPGIRKALTRFRISAHNLAIERGRYNRPPTHLEKRSCPHCPSNVEDELHFIIKCPQYNESRQALFEIAQERLNFRTLDDEMKFIYVMTAPGKITEAVAEFIQKHSK